MPYYYKTPAKEGLLPNWAQPRREVEMAGSHLRGDGRRLDRHGAARIVRRAGITKPAGPHTLRPAFITAALDAGMPLRDVQEAASHADPRTTMRPGRARANLYRHATYIVAAYIAGAAQ
jgi:integrase/recombinase XerD